MNRLLLACSLFVCVLSAGAFSGPVQAQAPAEDEAYQTAISEAVAEFSAGRWEEARSLFTEAHRINPNARTLRGLGMAAFELRNYVEALQMLQRALDSQVNPLTPELQTRTEDLLERTRAFVGMFEIEAPQGTTLMVDGMAPQYDNAGLLLLNSGKHRLEVRFPDGVEATRMVDVRGGEKGTLVFEQDVQAPSPTAPPVPAAAEADGPAPGGSPAYTASVESQGSALPLVLTGVGGAMIVGGVVTGLLAKGAESELEDACGAIVTMCPESNRDTRDRATTLATVTNVLWVGGAVMAALGITLFVLESDDGGASVQASAGVSPGSAGMNVWGRF